MKNTFIERSLLVFSAVLIFSGVFFAIAPTASAQFNFFNPLDPFGFFGDDDCNGINNCNREVNRPRNQPVSRNVGRTAVAQPNPSTQSHPPLQASCYASPGTARVGDPVTWVGFASGGNGPGTYDFTWSGTDGLSGSGITKTKIYSSAGFKSATLVVSSGSQQITRDCGAVNIYTDQPQPSQPPSNPNPPITNTNTNTNTNNVYVDYPSYPSSYPVYVPYYTPSYAYSTPHYNYPYYNYPYQYYNPVSVTCRPDKTFAPTGTRVTWTAYAAGGTGSYSYRWSGTDGLYGSGRNVNFTYYNSGQKTAYVTVTSDGYTATAQCSSITIGRPIQQYPYPPQYGTPTYPPYQQPMIDIACYASPTSIRTGQSTIWTATASGAIGPYRYSWSGTDGLSGMQNVISKAYYTSGTKSATITVTAADGRSRTVACPTKVTVTAPATAKASTAAPAPTATGAPQVIYVPYPPGGEQDPYPPQQANLSFFSLDNVPWGWVSFLIILILFVTVIYLIVNRTKI